MGTVVKRSPLRSISKRRRGELPARRALVARVIHRDRSQCQFARYWLHAGRLGDPFADARPCRYPLDVHEIIPRSAWAGGWLDDTNCVVLCRAHHEWVGDHPDHAHAIGLHGWSWEKPNGAR